jgi:hypothetical protein
MTLILSGTDGLSDVDGTAAAPAIRGTDANTGIFFPAADTIAFAEGGAEAMRIDSDGDLLVGGTSTTAKLAVKNNTNDGTSSSKQYAVFGVDTTYLNSDASAAFGSGLGEVQIQNGTSTRPAMLSLGGSLATGEPLGAINFFRSGNTATYRSRAQIASVVSSTGTANQHGGDLRFYTAADGGTNPTERARIDTSGNLLVGCTTVNVAGTSDTSGFVYERADALQVSRDNTVASFNRFSSDGGIIAFNQDGTTEGTVSVSGTTVSYNGGHLSRWAQTTAPKDNTLVKGTVLSNLDEMNVYTKDGHPVENEQLNKVKVSDVEGDSNVAGVFVNWDHDEAHNVDEINMAMTGDMIIRIAQGVTVARGDLLMSAGDGTAKPQGDDIVRSKTVAKVTSTHVTCTYADGSYCVPCVLMAC